MQWLADTLERVPEPVQALDLSAVDGFLVGLALQPRGPRRPSPAQWMPWVFDEAGRPWPPAVAQALDARRLQALVLARFQQLDALIEQRQWFDPWVLAPETPDAWLEVVQPWVLGFATACGHWPELTEGPWAHEPEFTEGLAQLYQHLDPDDLEDAEALLAELDTLEPLETLDEAVESLVRGSLLMADVSRPLKAALKR